MTDGERETNSPVDEVPGYIAPSSCTGSTRSSSIGSIRSLPASCSFQDRGRPRS